MSETKPGRRIVTALDMIDEREKRRQKRKYDRLRTKEIDGWNRPRKIKKERKPLTREDELRDQERRQYEKQRRRAIDGWNRPPAQVIKVNSPIQVSSKFGTNKPGTRIYTCPRCEGKKQMMVKDFVRPGAPPVVGVQPCKLCTGKGYLWI